MPQALTETVFPFHTALWTWHAYCIHELTAAVAIKPRPSQDCAYQHSIMYKEGICGLPPPP